MIPETDTVAPQSDPSAYGTTTDPNVIQQVVDDASVLLAGQSMVWTPDIELFPGSSYTYYRDDSILVIAWKQLIEGKCCTCAEVKIADGSQLRRKIVNDTYGSDVQMRASELAKEANAVIAMNADFYAYRTIGITVYQRTLYRFSTQLDTCFFTSSGDMLFSKAGALSTREEAEQFISENDVLFSTSFGPILVENGTLRKISKYSIGQITKTYSRAGIGMTDDLHYFLMTINYDTGVGTAATVQQLAQFMYDKGCIKAYGLDGGQTSEMWMNNRILNTVGWGSERQVSDILYFATAIPYEGGNG